MIPGLDLLGIASKNWDMKATLNAFPQGWALGLFADETFGPLAVKNTTKLLATGKVEAVRVHLNWDSKHGLPSLKKIKKLAPKWQALAVNYPTIHFYISPTCEYDSTSKSAVKEMLDLTASICTSCTIVQTPSGKGVIVDGYVIEKHGKAVAKPGEIVSYDGGKGGEGLFDIDAAKWIASNSNAAICFAWAPLFNMAEAHNTLPPNKRTASPSAGYITSLVRLFDFPGVAPTPSFAVTPLKKPLLYKSHAEDSPGVDPRNNRPLMILKEKLSSVDIVVSSGKKIATMKYFGAFPPNLQRYYSGTGTKLYGYQIADLANKTSGSPWVWIKAGNKHYGPIQPVFRTPFFQA